MNKFYPMALALLVVFLSPLGGSAQDMPSSPLQALLMDESTWSMTDEDFMKKAAPLRFVWTSDSRGSARSIDRSARFLNEPVLETVITFKDKKLYTALMSLYNKGDTAVINMDAYDAAVKRVSATLSNLTGVRPRLVNSRRATSVNLKCAIKSWQGKGISCILEYASSRTKNPQTRRIQEDPEYINLTIVKGGHREVVAVAGDQKASVNLMTLRQKIKKSENGDVYLEGVPMVDQGQKGYCANATTERVMKYYGVEVNQHRLAQRARTAAGGGTSSDALVTALKAMAGMMYLRLNELVSTDARDFINMMKDYNRAAKKMKKKEINVPTRGVINVPQIMASMDTDVFVASRTGNPTQMRGFEKNIAAKIDRGIPLIWSVTLGFVAEKPALPQAAGGHMRLIIGYNPKTSQIIYTDSWGRGHEFKHMDSKSAFAITKGLFTLEPMH